MKHQKLSTTITLAIALVTTVCIFLLCVIADRSMRSMMNKSELENLHASLNAQTNIIEEYLRHQEDLLTAYSRSSEVAEFLKDTDDPVKQGSAQQYTEDFYDGLEDWEGIYIAEWDSHVIAHSSSQAVGMYTREGNGLQELQDAISAAPKVYNAGIIVSPASKKLVLSLYCPVFDEDGKTITGYVGGGPFAESLKNKLDSIENKSADYFMLNVNTGKYIFNEDESLMGEEIQDEMLLSIISDIQSGKGENSGDMEYVDAENGKSIAAYQYMPEYGWALVSCDSEAHVYADANKSTGILGTICVIFDLLIACLSWLLIRLSIRPLQYVKKSILRLKELKLDKQHDLDKYINGKSEIGEIATVIDSLYDSFAEIASTMRTCSDSLTQSAVKMSDTSEVLIQCVEENSNTTEAFAKHSTSVSDTVKHVDDEMGKIVEVVSIVESRIQEGT